jgi:predicted membrane protein
VREAVNGLAKRGVAVLVLLAAAYLLFKVVLGVIATLAWIAVAVVAVVAVLWAVRTL